MALTVDTTPAKHVTVLRNGDNKYEGRKFIVSRRRYRTFDSLLSDITHQISAPFGAVRRLYTPKGRRQIETIEDLEGGGIYVAGGSERFKKLNYNPIRGPGRNWANTSLKRPGFLADDPPPLVLPKKNRRYAQRSAQFYKVHQPVQFTIFRNGLPQEKGFRFLLKSREMRSYEAVLSIISLKVRLVEGAVRRLYSVGGTPIFGVDEITDGGLYVACGNRRFIHAGYGEIAVFAKPQKLPAIKKLKDPNQPSNRTQSNPLPAIQKKPLQAKSKAKSEKDSPPPITDDTGEDGGGGLVTPSKKEIAMSKKELKQYIKPKLNSKDNTGPDKDNTIPDADDGPPTPKQSEKTGSLGRQNGAIPAKTGTPKSRIQTSEILQNAVNDSSVFNAPSTGQKGEDGQFLMNVQNGHDARTRDEADEVDEDRDLVEEKPIELQKAEEVEEEIRL